MPLDREPVERTPCPPAEPVPDYAEFVIEERVGQRLRQLANDSGTGDDFRRREGLAPAGAGELMQECKIGRAIGRAPSEPGRRRLYLLLRRGELRLDRQQPIRERSRGRVSGLFVE